MTTVWVLLVLLFSPVIVIVGAIGLFWITIFWLWVLGLIAGKFLRK